MPELPEVESVRRGLLPHLPGQKIRRVLVRRPKLVSGTGNIRPASVRKAREFESGLKGEVFADIERRGKNLLFRFQSGKIVLVHLKMAGRFLYHSEPNQPEKHTHIIFELSKGTLWYNDARRFGYVLFFPNEAALLRTGHFAKLGLEPLETEFTLAEFGRRLRAKRGNLKSVLLGQTVVAGLGNIYADEVCFRAGILPSRKVQTLKTLEIEKLYLAIRPILRRAIELGGSSVRTYLMANGEKGKFASEHHVYGRAGEPCDNCGAVLKGGVLAGRTTVYCAKCQK